MKKIYIAPRAKQIHIDYKYLLTDSDSLSLSVCDEEADESADLCKGRISDWEGIDDLF